MPEGDTVWRAARALDDALSGHTLVATDVRVPAFATVDLSGSTVTETVSRGKHLLTRIDGGQGAVTLHTHLKMEGGWRVLEPGQRWPRPGHTARVVLTTDDAVAVGFSLGIVEIVAGLVVLLLPRLGAPLVTAWLAGIIVNLLLVGGFGDIALRDFGLMLAALVLARLAWAYPAGLPHRRR